MTVPIGNYNTNIPTGINIQIFNSVPNENDVYKSTGTYVSEPFDTKSYPANYYTKDFSKKETQNINQEQVEVKKEINIKTDTKTKKIYLTDEYIKKLENYLSSKDVEKRVMAARDILERVQEDNTRKDNLALTALTNKMLKDPYQPIRFLALGILEERLITGNDETIETLKKVETGRYSKNGNTDQDAIKASNVLLKMTRKVQE